MFLPRELFRTTLCLTPVNTSPPAQADFRFDYFPDGAQYENNESEGATNNALRRMNFLSGTTFNQPHLVEHQGRKVLMFVFAVSSGLLLHVIPIKGLED